MTAVQIPWAPGARYIHVVCRLGEPWPDADDPDTNPDLMTQSGTVTLQCDAPLIRYTEADGRTRALTMGPWQFDVRASDGELVNADGTVGVKILSGFSDGVDPTEFTWSATISPTGGKPFRSVVPALAGGTFDLVMGADIPASVGTPTLTSRVAALEAGSGGGGVTIQQVIQQVSDALYEHSNALLPHPVYDEIEDLALVYNAAKI